MQLFKEASSPNFRLFVKKKEKTQKAKKGHGGQNSRSSKQTTVRVSLKSSGLTLIKFKSICIKVFFFYNARKLFLDGWPGLGFSKIAA